MTDELEDLKKYIGNKHSSEDVVTASQVGRLAGALMAVTRLGIRAIRCRPAGTGPSFQGWRRSPT